MSRVAKAPVSIPAGVEVKVDGQTVTVKGKTATLSKTFNDAVVINVSDKEVTFAPREGFDKADAHAGTARAIVNSFVSGLVKPFEKKLTLIGVGYRAAAKGNVLSLALGYSHPIEYAIPEGVSVECPSQTEIVLKSADKALLGQVAANVRAYRAPEPYKGKGVRYADEVVRIKETKKKSGKKMDKKSSRLRRALKARCKMAELGAIRLVVFRTPRHIYAQVIDDGKVIVAASTLEKEVKEQVKYTGNKDAAKVVGKIVAERALAKDVKTVSFDRSGFQYHGRVAALAEGAREAGLQF